MFSCAFALLAIASTARQQETPPREPAVPIDKLAERVDALCREAVEKGGVPGLSILVARDRETLIAKGFGYADAKRGEPATEETAYSIGTLTNLFTAAGILQLVEADKLKLDDTLGKLLPGFPPPGHAITVRQLLTNTSGLPSPSKLLAKKRAQEKPEKPSDAQAGKASTPKDEPRRDEKKDEPKKEPPKKEPPDESPGQVLAPDHVAPAFQGEKGREATPTKPPAKTATPTQQPQKPAAGVLDVAKKEAETAALLELFRDVPFDFAPGEGHSEDTAGWLVLGVILSRVAGEDYADYVRAHFLEPLDLADTVFCPLDGGTQGFADDCLTPADERELELPSARKVDVVPASDQADRADQADQKSETRAARQTLCSTVGDLLLWQQALNARTLLGEESTRLLLSSALRDGETDEADGEEKKAEDGAPWRFRSHSGVVTGFQSHIAFYPDARLSIVVLANCSTAPLERIEKAIARDVLGLLPPEVEIADLPLEEADIARYAGRYQIASTLVRIFEREGRLWYEVPTQPTVRLMFQGRHLFVRANEEETRLTFQVEGDKPAHGFTLMRDGLMSTGKRME